MNKFNEINDQLDQELEFFLIKRDIVYVYIHFLAQYVTFLSQKELIVQTKRSKVAVPTSKEPLHGFYSSRSKREDVANKYIRKNETGNRMGYRCDSDRKITLEDEEIIVREKEYSKPHRRQSMGKHGQLKRVFK